MIFVIHICISVLIIYITAMRSARGSTSTAPPPTGSCTSSHIWHSNSEPSHKKQSLLPAGPELQSCWLQGLSMPVSKCPEERFSKKAVYCHSWGYQPYQFCPEFDHRHCPWYLTGDSIICIKYIYVWRSVSCAFFIYPEDDCPYQPEKTKWDSGSPRNAQEQVASEVTLFNQTQNFNETH